MVSAMCGQKAVDRKTTEEQMVMLGLKETIDRLATTNGVRWYGHELRRDDHSVLRVDLDLEVSGIEKARKTEEDLEKASGGDREDLFEGGCPDLSKVERRSASNRRRNGVNPAISAKGTASDRN